MEGNSTLFFLTDLGSKFIIIENHYWYVFMIVLHIGMGLLDVVKAVKPNVLIGLSTCGGLFTGMQIILSNVTIMIEELF